MSSRQIAIQTHQQNLPHGITLSCRSAGERGRPLMLFVHGFPEGAFVWDALMQHFARPEHGGYRCIAPNLRGFEQSSAPEAVEDYRPQLLVKDLQALVATERDDGHVDTLVCHDWGGALGWGFANAWPEQVGRLVSINSPHAGTFLRELQHNPAQQHASAYMHFLARPGSEALLMANDFERLFGMVGGWREDNGAPPTWLTDAVRAQYRSVWRHGLRGGCNLYRATPLKPPVAGQTTEWPEFPPERLRCSVPTLVIWGEQDRALLPTLLDGLSDHVPDLRIHRIANASHWVVHERPDEVIAQIQAFQAERR